MAFASAIDCWAFNLGGFSRILASKFGMNARALQKFLWGEYYYRASDKKIFSKPPTAESKPMFVQYVLDPLVKEYKKLFYDGIVVNSVEYREAKTKIKNVLCKWMPVEKGILSMVVLKLPSPVLAQRNRVSVFCPALNDPENEHKSEEDF